MTRNQSIGIVIALVAVVVIGAFVYAARTSDTTGPDGRMQVSASFYPMAYLAERIGGEHVSVTNLTPSGSEPHDFEPSARDIAKLEDADILILNGGIEAWGERVISQLQSTDVRVVVAGEGLLVEAGAEEQEHADEHHHDDGHGEEEHSHGGVDPHLWLDPVLYKQQAVRVAEALIEKDPEHADAYRANLATLSGELDALDSEFRTGLSSCAADEFVTSHTAFAYLAERYGLHQVSISGISPETEPSPAELAEVTDFAREHGVRYIFFETLVSPSLSQTIAREVGAQTLVLDPIEGLTKEDLSSGMSYLSVMRENLANLRIALQCS